MHPILKKYQIEIEKYCVEHGLAYNSVFYSYHSGGASNVDILHHDERKKYSLSDDTVPAAVMLRIFLENGRLRFVQTDITHKYLGVDREAVRPPAAKRPIIRRLPAREHAYA